MRRAKNLVIAGARLLSIVVLGALCASSVVRASPRDEESGTPLARALLAARAGALSRVKGVAKDHWNLPLSMGAHYVSQYYLMRFWFAHESAETIQGLHSFDETRFRNELLNSQLADGSWQPVPEPNLEHGNLDATIMNYWALKVMGVSTDSDAMTRARAFVSQHGGLEKASTFSRIVLALFTQLSWSSVPWSPMFFVNPNNPSFMNVEQFPQWVRPHILPISYLRSLRVQRDLGARFNISELHAIGVAPPRRDRQGPRDLQSHQLALQLLQTTSPAGSWGGYTSATVFSVAVLDDDRALFAHNQDESEERLASRKGLQFIDALYLGAENPWAYQGSVCDGRYWDSILILQGLAGRNPESAAFRSTVESAANFLTRAQVSGGGIPFGKEFERTPDVDDTAEMITTLQLVSTTRDQDSVKRATRWVLSMQNRDGGWGAFDRNNNGNWLLRMMTRGLSDSATLFDPSTPDVTGHALEALGSTGLDVQSSPAVQAAVKYLRKNQVAPNGVWPGRWGVNYLYGTNAAISGLLRAGVPVSDPLIQVPLTWMKAHQNADGGFGETTHSDLDARQAGEGISTPSQTAWALMSLVRAGEASGHAAKSAVDYLLRTQGADGTWVDSAVVGTGHSGIVYLTYPSYPIAFPLIALNEYERALNQH